MRLLQQKNQLLPDHVMANHGPLCKEIENDKEDFGRDSECKMVRF